MKASRAEVASVSPWGAAQPSRCSPCRTAGGGSDLKDSAKVLCRLFAGRFGTKHITPAATSSDAKAILKTKAVVPRNRVNPNTPAANASARSVKIKYFMAQDGAGARTAEWRRTAHIAQCAGVREGLGNFRIKHESQR